MRDLFKKATMSDVRLSNFRNIYSTKYHAQRTEYDGIKFASKKECLRYIELKNRLKDGTIQDLKLQVPYILIEKSRYGRAIKYIADFTYTEFGEFVVEDVKGMKTPVYKLKKRLMAEKYGIVIKES